ncbi:MAG: hypothetical protein QNJ70_20195 [Xenococcaceae cyanobacterium MO_207.B15]|nr:hypothetical protein [Xenococcaceae cyanobacterium MO_207.B15]
MKGLTFFETNFYKQYKLSIDNLNPSFFPGIYFEVELEALWKKYEEAITSDKFEEQTEDEIIAQYDKLYSVLIAGSINDKELLETDFDDDGNELEID